MGTDRRTRRPRLRGATLQIGRKRVPLLSGAVHYWRLEPKDWPRAIGAVADMGFDLVETYVPWGVHERGLGEFDFGEVDPRRDVGAFLDRVAEAGLLAIVRPGPCINAELTHFGLPERIVFDPACQARSPRQRPVLQPFPPRMFPIPSHASRAYHREVGRWYDAVAKVLAPRLWPDGPIVLLQVDNEAAFYFRDGPYEQDYHPDALGWWAAFLERRYERLDRLSEAYGQPVGGWDEVAPPRRPPAGDDPAELRRAMDWAAFREALLARGLGRMKRRMQRAGLSGVPTLHNVPLGGGGLPLTLSSMGREVNLVGLDYYHAAREHRTVKRRTLRLVGTVGEEAAYAPKMGAGAPPWYTPLEHRDSLYTACCALAFGLRGFNLYMAVDRDRWYGAPVRSDGTPRPEADDWRRLLGLLRHVAFHQLRRRVEVAICWPHEYARLSRATHRVGLLSPSGMEALGGTPVDGCDAEPRGLGEPVQLAWWQWMAAVSDALTEARIPYVYVDSDAPPERFTGYRLLVAPSFAFASPERMARLRAAAEDGATVLLGPRWPDLDDRLEEHDFGTRFGELLEVDEPAPLREALLAHCERLGLRPPLRVGPAPLEATLHETQDGVPRVLFVLNPDERSHEARLELPGPWRLRDAWTEATLEAEADGSLPMEVPARTVRVLEIVDAQGGTR